MEKTERTPGPLKCELFHGTDEDIALARKHGLDPVPALSNEGQRFLMAGSGDDRKRVALVDCQTKYKRGQGYLAECRERDANAAFIVQACNSFDALLSVARSVVREYEATFVDPEEMSGEWKQIYDEARAALQSCGDE